MELILSRQCESLTGSLGSGFGYHIQRRTDSDGTIHFWGVRKSKGTVPSDGHLRFILTCANLAQNKLHISDIRVDRGELCDALREAGLRKAAVFLATSPKEFPSVFCKDDIIDFKNKHNL